MKIPVSWLNEYIDISDLSVEELAKKITFCGIEVEGVETVGAALSEKFVVGEILTAEKHPGADKLQVCTVFDGAEKLQIVCGAPNAAAGLKVPLAKIGAVVPNGGFEIKRAKIRGVESFGMLCSASELAMSSDHSGLLVLDPALAAGTPVRDVLPPPEIVFDLEITWNRSDCLSIIGIAREFSAVLGRPLKMPSVELPEASGKPASEFVRVEIQAPDLCPRYTARILTGVQKAETPAWMKRRLELCGVRPLSLAVDVTNYVMLECGQPLHAFDFNQLADRAILVRRAAQGEKITTLDNVPRTLTSEMLVIADAQRAVAVAGVMGAANSEIAETTGDILIESATFAAPSVKATATALGIRTEASHRFERTVDPELADWASRRAAALIAQHTAATLAPGVVDVDCRATTAKREITLRLKRAREVIGLDLDAKTMVDYLLALGLTIAPDSHRGPSNAIETFSIPSWRNDLEIEADLIEEIARLHGLDAIPDTLAPAIPSALDDTPFHAQAACRETLVSLGFAEAVHYSFLSKQELDAFDSCDKNRLVLPNPVSADYAVMRDSLLPQLLQTTGRNAAQLPESPVALFEIGRVFNVARTETTRLALALTGPAGRKPLDMRRAVSNDEALLSMKGVLEALAAKLRAGTLTLAAHGGRLSPAAAVREDTRPPAALQPAFTFTILLDEKPVGILGLAKPKILHQWRLSASIAVAEIELAPLLARPATPRVQPVPRFPSIRRDLALVASPGVCHGDIENVIREAAGPCLTRLQLFDIYVGKEMEGGKRSLAYALEFRSPEKTLTDVEVNAAFGRIIQSLGEKLQVELRDL
ncbi:MAG: phenylalanine--tRNA ligase subunit beta [Kiritimatiellaeota bacterium]|nr:phenylalanine--tRNA ligase subunit beta [Kiritimatiellota bacterium]